jgi:hypothetical protein
MRLFKSKEANLVHYVTGVTYNRFPIFRDDYACALFIDALDVPIEIDQRWLWTEDELSATRDRRTSPPSKRKEINRIV